MADRLDIQNVLGQMRALQAQVQQGVPPVKAVPEQPDGTPGFGDVLKMAVDKVNDQQASAKKMAEAYERGDPTVDLPQVMIGLQKASVSFEAMNQVRNRLVSAYEDISKMPI
ncbi:flagellar hook-basal body complex protein FliE [Motiliproteus sp. MSK22-1]|uniref:flagellar hook-basal body complex protein FliE n=1 Tax=Motiliproteus sp. MSK22-1 TaxID=1897630 RepID=UPI0009777B6C|nr:flagellar hook-basal body complex protein FliE [Motiliproteus sp. MSK22-1]OMH30032.1 flagellar hook-basal body complex protein FliE [Motiliproteus sp. MSK22-1]